MKDHPFLVGALAGGAIALAGYWGYIIQQQNQSSWTGTVPVTESLSAAVIVGAVVWLVASIIT